jgi:hypothetical protein
MLGIRTGEVCEMAGLPRQKFNDAVRDNFFKCAPDTKPGSTRVFDHNQIVSVFIFADLLRMGVGAREAGTWSCLLYNAICRNEDPKATMAAIVSDATGARINVATKFNGYCAGSGSKYFAFDVGDINARIEREIKNSPNLKFTSVAGDDDGEP